MPLLNHSKPRGLIANPPEPTLALESIRQAERAYHLRFPDDYRDLAQECNGFKCRFPNGCELELWPFTELAARNDSHAINDIAPALCMIGTEYNGEALVVERSTQHYLLVPLIGLEAEHASHRCTTLPELLEALRCEDE
ncbi:MAG: SMI1/KNR4 family protein [Phycisphaerales bacterium JB054]